jgi:hypothetical protein
MTPREAELTRLVRTLSVNGSFNARSLNVKSPDAPAATQSNWTILHNLLMSDNSKNNFEKLLNDLLYTQTYDSAAAVFRSLVPGLTTATGRSGRILVCLPDGTVYFDSARRDGVIAGVTDSNTFTNASGKKINENHNTRVAIMIAQSLQYGYAFESKLSTSTNRPEDYVAVRIGPQGASDGTVRYSVY